MPSLIASARLFQNLTNAKPGHAIMLIELYGLLIIEHSPLGIAIFFAKPPKVVSGKLGGLVKGIVECLLECSPGEFELPACGVDIPCRIQCFGVSGFNLQRVLEMRKRFVLQPALVVRKCEIVLYYGIVGLFL